MKKTLKRLISIWVIISFIGIYVSSVVKPQYAFAEETAQQKRDRIEREESAARWGLILVGLAAVVYVFREPSKFSEESNTIPHGLNNRNLLSKINIKLVNPVLIHKNYFLPNTMSNELPIPMMEVTLVRW